MTKIKNTLFDLVKELVKISNLFECRHRKEKTVMNEMINAIDDYINHRTYHYTAMADRFYKDIRCGILHAAQTQNGSCLTFDSDYTVRTRVDGALMVDIRGMCNETCQYFDRYCNELKNTFNNELRENFIKKMDHITLKGAEGSEAIDNLWFALCENGYTRNSIESRRGGIVTMSSE